MKFRVQPCTRQNGVWINWRIVTGRGRGYRVVSYHPSEAEALAEVAKLNQADREAA